MDFAKHDYNISKKRVHKGIKQCLSDSYVKNFLAFEIISMARDTFPAM